jgi:predicted dehydrogenase
MGRLHARTVRSLASRGADFSLARVFDRHQGRAEAFAADFAAAASEDLEALSDQVDVAIVAVPTAAHFEIATFLLERGVDLLIEKPFTAEIAEAEALVATARAAGRIVQVGHVEWYNPSWRDAARGVGDLRRIEIDRLQPWSERGRDIDVIQDLMLHDLDWTTRWVDRPIVDIEAAGTSVDGAPLDEASAEIRFEDGCVVKIRSSRIHRERRREARFEGSAGHATADLVVARSVDEDSSSTASCRDPLETQWIDFMNASIGRVDPVNDGRIGLDALRLVERVRNAIISGKGRSSLDDDSRLRR